MSCHSPDEAIAVDRLARVQPRREVARRVGRVALLEVARQQREMVGRGTDMPPSRRGRSSARRASPRSRRRGRRRRARRRRTARAARGRRPRAPRSRSRPSRARTRRGRRASTRRGCRPRRPAGPRPRARRARSRSAMSPIAPSRSSFDVVPSSWTVTSSGAQSSKAGAKREFVTSVDLVDLAHLAHPVEQVVEHRPPREREQHLRDRVRQRPEPGRVPGGEDERLHRRAVPRRPARIGAKSALTRAPGPLRCRRVAGGTLLPTRWGSAHESLVASLRCPRPTRPGTSPAPRSARPSRCPSSRA